MSAPRDIALAAASQAADATAELITFAREGALGSHANFVGDPVEKLADACKMALEIEIAAGAQLDDDQDRLLSALGRYLEGWAG
jgi:hypothetical protein